MSRIVIASVMLAALMSAGRVSVAQEADTSGVALPKAVRNQLNDRFKGWTLATVENTGACAATLNGRSPSFVRADLNGDGTEDVALQIATADGVRIVAVISRLYDDVLLVEVDQVAGAASDVLGFAPRGKKYLRTDLFQVDYFSTDTLTASRCGEGATAYFWTGTGFLKRTITY